MYHFKNEKWDSMATHWTSRMGHISMPKSTLDELYTSTLQFSFFQSQLYFKLEFNSGIRMWCDIFNSSLKHWKSLKTSNWSSLHIAILLAKLFLLFHANRSLQLHTYKTAPYFSTHSEKKINHWPWKSHLKFR